ncbi:hypothetical protein HZA56_01085 [Candidatus Poribacteria bacterium]|nr:hypothetical protein [Candidatus Poribacteria bacterium]
MTANEISLFILAGLIALLGWYVDTHGTDKPRRKRRHRRARPAMKAPTYEPDDGPLTAKQIKAIKRLVPQGRMKKVRSSLF